MSKSLFNNFDGPKVLTDTANRIFEWRTSDLAEILLAVLNLDPKGLKVYTVNTEFYRPATGGASIMTEVAFVNVINDQVIVYGVLKDNKRAVDASIKLALGEEKRQIFKSVLPLT